MLNSLTITNYTLTDQLEVDFSGGMSAITGETGTGKSLVIDALGMALGDRGDTGRIRPGTRKTEVAAQFDINGNLDALSWLIDNDYLSEDELSETGLAEAELTKAELSKAELSKKKRTKNKRPTVDETQRDCLLRRVLTTEGRSRGYINGQSATMQQLKELGERLVDIHGQHEHQSLLRRDSHLRLLDEYGNHIKLLTELGEHYQQWHTAAQRLNQLENQSGELEARRDLLTFQVQELDQLAPLEGEIGTLESEQQLLANADTVLNDCQQALILCQGDDSSEHQRNINHDLNQALQLIQDLSDKGLANNSNALTSSIELLRSAQIQIQEAAQDIEHFVSGVENNPAHLQEVEERLSHFYQLARKHRIEAHELPGLHQSLAAELNELSGGDADLEQLREKREQLAEQYRSCAKKLSKARKKNALSFAKQVNAQLSDLGMATASLELALTTRDTDEPHPLGMEKVELLAQTNPGHPHRPLAKIASGGELSRFSLAIQVIAAERAQIPALIFDEVDVGIGGATAEVVGKLLRKLGERGQVIAVTHLPQVASCAHQQLVATKSVNGDETHSQLIALDDDMRADEIARMLGGAEITSQSLAHAKEMLGSGQDSG